MDENMAKFLEKLKELVPYARKKKGVLEFQEINDFFGDIELNEEQVEKIYEYLEANHVDILRSATMTIFPMMTPFWKTTSILRIWIFPCPRASAQKIRCACT